MSKKRNQILQAAIRLFAKEGVGVATAKIAKEADVSNGTLFNHFATKQELIDSVYIEIKIVMTNDILSHLHMNQSLHDLFLEIWNSYAIWCYKHVLEKTVLDLLKTSQLLTEEAKTDAHEAWEKIAKKITTGIEDKQLVQIAPEMIFLSSEAMLDASMNYATKNKFSEKDIHTTVKQMFEIFWRGIKAS